MMTWSGPSSRRIRHARVTAPRRAGAVAALVPAPHDAYALPLRLLALSVLVIVTLLIVGAR